MIKHFINRIQVSIPFRMLHESYLPRFIDQGINPEIGFDATAIEGYTFSEFAHVSEQLHHRGLTITMHFPFMDLHPGSPDPGVRALTRHRFEQMLPLVNFFRPKAVVCHAGYEGRRYGFMKESWTENSLTLWRWLGERIRGEGGSLMLENVYEDGPGDIQDLLKGLADLGVRFCLDSGHQAAFSGVSLRNWVEVLAPYLGELHLHDNSGSHDDHLALGTGAIDFEGFLVGVKRETEETPIVTIEPHREQDLWPSIEYLQRIWPW